MLAVFREKRRDRELIDVEIVVESQKIPVHRLILQTCSNYFDALLKNMASNSTNPPMGKCECDNCESEYLFDKISQLFWLK